MLKLYKKLKVKKILIRDHFFWKFAEKKFEKGGGSSKSLRSFYGGVIEMSTFVYKGGRGGQKSPKNCLRSLCMPPKMGLVNNV